MLCELWIKGPLKLRNLAAFMMVSRPPIVGTVDTLEANALVSRARSSADRRLVMVALTDAGLSLIERADASWHECQAQVVSGLTSADKVRLAELSWMLTTATLALKELATIRL
ncbi:MAG: MarR family transcriptional regulator [Tepidiformaceae bacterium]